MNYVYILRCADGSLYTGWTNDLEKRVKTHNAGKGAKYTPKRGLRLSLFTTKNTKKRERLYRVNSVSKSSKKQPKKS